MIRGCGKRKPGGVYICSKLNPGGLPLNMFIIDPPLSYDDKPFRVPIIVERDGINHLLFWVGKEYYPFTSDFIEEVRLFGASKRVPANFPIEKLDNRSMMFFAHPGAVIKAYEGLPKTEYCPKMSDQKHRSSGEYCIGHVYQVAPASNDGDTRTIGDTSYHVYPPENMPENLSFKPGIFLRLPITDIDNVLKDGKAHPEVTIKAASVKININYVEE
jgi:hypothetical protein